MHNYKKTGFFERQIHKLRAKPASYRQTFAFLASLVVTLILIALWSVSTIANIASIDTKKETASASSSLSVFSTIKNQFSDVLEKNPINENYGDENNNSNTATISDDGQDTATDENLIQY